MTQTAPYPNYPDSIAPNAKLDAENGCKMNSLEVRYCAGQN
jgi:hypothetical protein